MEIAYFAGLLDADGTIRIMKQFSKFTDRTPNYMSMIGVYNTNEKVISLLKKNFGGTVFRQSYGNNKILYRWRLCGNKASPVVKKILPFLIIKHRQAELILEFENKRRRCKSGVRVPLEEINKREMYFQRMKKLNKK